LSGDLRPDAILMDIIMPDMDGITATSIIHKIYPEIQIIGLTSFGDMETVHKELDAGAAACIFKNTTIDELANTIRKTFHNSNSKNDSSPIFGIIGGMV
jgi:two-component system, NarL family, response regulator LiaR